MADTRDVSPTGGSLHASTMPRPRSSTRPTWGAVPVLLAAATLFFFSSTWEAREFIALLPAVVLTLVGATLWWKGRLGHVSPTVPVLLALALLVYDLALPRVLHDPDGRFPVGTWQLAHTVVWLLTGMLLLLRLRSKAGTGRWLASTLMALTLLSGASLIAITPQPPIDVWQLHQQAGEALVAGDNPYADIRVTSTFRSDEDSAVMTGYAYPPIGLLTNGLAGAWLGDPRWASLAGWLAVIALVGSRLRRDGNHRAALLFLLASQPAWYLVLEAAYSELVSIALLVAGVLTLRRRYLGPVLFGLGLGSKQYLAALLPLVAIAPVLTIRQRLITVLTSLVALGGGIVWGVTEYVDAAFLLHLRVPPQEKAANLFGMLDGFGVGPIPLLVVAVVIVGATVALGRQAATPARLGIAAAAILSLAFLLSPQAFANYWLVVAVLVLLSLLNEPLLIYSDSPESATSKYFQGPD